MKSSEAAAAATANVKRIGQRGAESDDGKQKYARGKDIDCGEIQPAILPFSIP